MRFTGVVRGLAAALLLSASTAFAVGSHPPELTVTFIDVEGGQATLFVDPGGRSLLIDTGWDRPDGRDAERIADAARKLGLTKIDYVLITHFHDDHVGDVPYLAKKIPVGTFLDHGALREHGGKMDALYASYEKVVSEGHYGHIVAKPGDVHHIGDMTVTTLSSDAQVISKTLAGGGEKNAFCPATPPPADTTENQRSLGSLITFGKLRILDLGDLTKDMEYKLMCPLNRIGPVDVLIVSHHGWYQSSSPALVNAITPRVSIMDNGAKKGGSTPTLETLNKVPSLETRWQLHTSEEGGKANTDARYIANVTGEPDVAHSLLLKARFDGAFEITNTRTGYTQTYPAKK